MKIFKIFNHELDKKRVFFFSFFLAFLGYLPFLIRDHGFFTYFGDYNLQQIPFYMKVHESIRTGTLFFDLKTDLGSSLYTSYSFYLLGSPFFYLTLPFPKEFIPYLMPYLSMLKIALACLGGYLYTGKFVQDKRSAFLGGLLYGFCGFQVISLVFHHFGEVLAIFPFYLLALDNLAEKKKRGIFALLTAFMAILNYFFFINVSVFTLIYVMIRFILPNTFSKKERFFCFLRITYEGIIGILLSGFFLFPSLLSVFQNQRVRESILDKNLFFYSDLKIYGAFIKNLFLPPDIINRATIFGTYEGSVGSMSLFLPLFALSGVIAFYLNKEEKDFRKKLCIICLLLALIPLGNSLFVVGNGTYYARWFFMPTLFLSTMTASSIENFNKKCFTKGFLIQSIFVGLFFLLGIISKRITGESKDFLMVSHRSHFNLELFLAFSSLLFLIYLVFLLEKDKKRNYLNPMVSFTCFFCVSFLFLHLYMGCSVVNDVGRTSYQKQIKNMPTLPDEEKNSFYRIETDKSSHNYGMSENLPCINSFISTVSGSIMDFYDFAGINRTVSSSIPYDRIGLRCILSARYFLQNEFISEDYGFEAGDVFHSYEKIDTQNGFRIYENKYYIKPGSVYTYYMKLSEYEKLSEKEKDYVLLYALILKDDILKSEKIFESLMELTANDFVDLYGLNFDSFQNQCNMLNQSSADSFTYNDSTLVLTYTNEKAGLAFLSVPYSNGFTAYLNDEKTTIYKVDGGLMAVYLPAGEYTITYLYKEPGLFFGILYSLFGFILFMMTWIYDSFHNKK